MRIVLALLATLAAACVSVPSSSSTAESGPLGDPSVRAKLREIALQASMRMGVASPQTMLAVASPDHQFAEEIASGGSSVNDHAPVYVVEMTGGPFIDNLASLPPGSDAPTPQGDVLVLTLNAQTFGITDVGVQMYMPDLHLIDAQVVDLLADK